MNLIVLLSDLVKPLLMHPEKLFIEEKTENNKKVIMLKMDSFDTKKIIGNRSKIFRSIRTLVRFTVKDHSVELALDVVA